jgi:hypothetical protein
MKFKAGDIVKFTHLNNEVFKVVKIAEKGETVKGPWSSLDPELKMSEKSYILEDEDSWWWADSTDNLNNGLELVTKEKLKKEAKEKIEDFREEVEAYFNSLKTLENLYKNEEYYEILCKGV